MVLQQHPHIAFPTGNLKSLYNSFFIILLQDDPDIAPSSNPSKKFSLSSLYALDV